MDETGPARNLTAAPDSPELPRSVTITDTPDLRMTPNELRLLKQETGRSLTELLGEDSDDADRFQAIAWLNLRRDGFEPSWADVGDVAIQLETSRAEGDRSSGGPSGSSPGSSISGGD